jgi:hypothetical protein
MGRLTAFLGFVVLLIGSPLRAATAGGVTLARVPQGGLQPQIVVDDSKTVHLIYLIGAANASDINYCRSTDDGATRRLRLRVNDDDARAIATGTIRGPHLAVGANGTVHVAWMVSPNSMCYARLPRGAEAFDKPRNLVTDHPGLDGGGSVAVDSHDRVYVAWHAPEQKDGDEASRRVYLATSTDDGKTFAPERAIFDRPTGACGCCGMRIFASPDDRLFCLYRVATQHTHRGLFLLASDDAGKTWRGVELDPMTLGTCLMSTAAFARAGNSTLVAWETKGQVFWSRIDSTGTSVAHPVHPAGEGDNQKYPSLAASAKTGDVLLAWTENTRFGKGGDVCWQIYDSRGGMRTGMRGKVGGLPAFSFPAAFTNNDGSFSILY